MFFGNGHFAVQVVTIHQKEHLCQHVPLVFLHHGDVFADSCKYCQVGNGLEVLVLAVCGYKACYVFPLVRPAEGKYERFVRPDPEAVQFVQQGHMRLF